MARPRGCEYIPSTAPRIRRVCAGWYFPSVTQIRRFKAVVILSLMYMQN